MGECMIKSELTSAFFKDYLSYNATTGKFFWLSRHDGKFKCWVDARRWNGHYAGKEAGSKSGPAKGYVAIKIALVGDMFFAHRIAALHLNLIQTYGDKRQIDHIDGNPLNNKAENLRACTRSINGRNRKRHCDNTSGISGVRFLKKLRKFTAAGRSQNKSIHLGCFDTIFEAACVRRSWEQKNQYTKRHI